MLLKYFTEWKSWLAWDEESTGKKCGKAAEEMPETVLSLRGGLMEARAKWTFPTM